MGPTTELAGRALAIPDLERRRWKYAGAKDQALRTTFEPSPAPYQVLNVLLDPRPRWRMTLLR